MAARTTLNPTVVAVTTVTLAVSCGSELPTRSAVLITLDTTDPAVLGCYGSTEGATPHLDALAASGIVFEDARTVAPLTLPAHASVLTGLVPLRHGVRRNGANALAAEATTLAERARERGLATGAVIAAVVLDPAFGTQQGFDTYDYPPMPDGPAEHLRAARTADEVAGRAELWLSTLDPDEPFFLWVHFFDPHQPLTPPEPFASRFADPYVAEVASMDAGVGRVLAKLEELGRTDDTLVAVVGDHGEGRGRHGEKTHAAFCWDTTLAVPLIVRDPWSGRSGRDGRVASVVDVYPTLLEALRLGAPGDVDGRDLAGPVGDEVRHVYFESYFGTMAFGWSQLAGAADHAGKYVHSSSPQFFDLANDPDETTNLLDERAAHVQALREAVQRFDARPKLPVSSGLAEYRGLAREIERLGYAGAGERPEEEFPPLADLDRPSPHDRIDDYAAYVRAEELLALDEPAAARELLRGVVAGNPEQRKAWLALGTAAQALEDWQEAADAFERAAVGGSRITALLNRGVCLANLGRTDDAIRSVESALAATDGPPGALELLATLHRRNGDEDAARRVDARRLNRGSR